MKNIVVLGAGLGEPVMVQPGRCVHAARVTFERYF
jgi:hypothetical protein